MRAFEPAVFAGMSALLAPAMVVACDLPARRTTAIEPVAALRDQ